MHYPVQLFQLLNLFLLNCKLKLMLMIHVHHLLLTLGMKWKTHF